MKTKTYKKSSAFWKHGKHKGLLGIAIEKNKPGKKAREPMFDSIKEALKRK